MSEKLLSMRVVALSVLLLLAIIVVLVGFFNGNEKGTLGSVVAGQEYNATTTVGMPTGFNQLKSTSGSLGSIVVASSSAGTLKIWNATSTTDTASTSPVQFIASPTQGTYTFDAAFPRGIIVDVGTGFNGSYTITFR